MSEEAFASTTLCLGRCKFEDHGHSLGLKTSDILVGVDGQQWRGSLQNLKTRFSQKPGHVALTFQRGDAVWSILTERLDLGEWRQVARTSASQMAPTNPEFLCNWEVVVNCDGTHDLFALRPSLAALVAPALWLAQQRLWTLLATLVAGLAVALPAGMPVVIGLWAAAGLHLWRSGTNHIRADRAAAGFHRVGIVAAQSEIEAIAFWESLNPTAQFRFLTPAPPLRMAAPT